MLVLAGSYVCCATLLLLATPKSRDERLSPLLCIQGVKVKGEFLELKNTINQMVDRLGTFAAEVSKMAREVGTDGTLGGQA